jgi:hypothetical protein
LHNRYPRPRGLIRAAAATVVFAATLAFAAASASADPPTITFYTNAGWAVFLHEPITPATDPWISDWAGKWVSGLGGQQWELWIDANDGEGYAQCDTKYYVDGTQWDQRTNPAFQNWYSGIWNCSGDPTTNYADLFYLPTQNMSALANGAHTITAVASDDYGGVGSSAFTIYVDNTMPSQASMSGPVGWHRGSAVVVSNATTSGPSGIRGQSCSVGSSPAVWYGGTSAHIPVSGDGDIEVDCTAQNGAYVNGPRTGFQVLLDNSPPNISLEPQNPSDPTGVVVDTSDRDSGVANGSIQIAPAGTTAWTNLPTSFDGAHLLAHIDDVNLRGPYTILATSCDNVGNCASTQSSVTLPARIVPEAAVGFIKIDAPAKVLHRRVLVDWHYEHVRRHHRRVRVRVGGHYLRVRFVVRAHTACEHKRLRTGPHRWRTLTACRPVKILTKTSERLGYGKSFTVNGLLITTQGVPVAGVPVSIFTAPNNGLGQFSLAAGATTSSTGAWSATLPPGPSRIIRAVYGGSATVLPTTAQASVNVPTKIKLSVSSRAVPWTGVLVLHGHLEGGYVPTDGVALRLLIRLPGHAHPYEPVPFRTDAAGNFTIRWTWGRGFGVATYPFAVATTATESDFPFAASRSRWIPVTFGVSHGTTTSSPKRRVHHHRRHRSHHHKRR